MGTLRIIAIIVALLSVVNSATLNYNEIDFRQLHKAFYESSEYIRREVRNEHAAICIGATRSGRSTLINYLIGNKLKAVRVSPFFPITIEKAENQSIGPEIGRGSISKTTIPTKWKSRNLTHLIIWDTPGLEDNRGAIQELTNAFYLHQLVQHVKSLKIILVVDISDILHDNIKPFVSALKAIESLLGDKMSDYFKSISVIFTKVPNMQDGVPVKMINEILKYQFLSSFDMEISKLSIDFIQHLITNNNQIAIFKRPDTLGDINLSIDVNIFPAIINSISIEKEHLKQLHPSISDSSILFLYKICGKLYSASAFDELGKTISQIIEKKSAAILTWSKQKNAEDELKKLSIELDRIKDKIFSVTFHQNDFSKKIDIVEMMDTVVINKVEKNQILGQILLVEFVDKLLNLEESKILVNKLQGIFMTSCLKINEASSTALLKLVEITQQKQEEMMKSKTSCLRMN